MFSKQNVQDAWMASKTQEYARANRITAEDAARESYGKGPDLASLEQYKRGAEILKRARLIVGSRYQRYTAAVGKAKLNPAKLDSPIINVFAGHIATHEATRQVGLKRR